MSFGIYIHVPFCRRRCAYCDFYLTTNTRLIDDFINALNNEIRIFSGLTSDRNIDTVYFGGGTPSMLLPKQINEILDTLNRHFALSANPEISIECNPEDILAENNILEDYAKCGINRLSIGVQSFLDDELKFLTRCHDASGSYKSVQTAKDFFDNVSVDIIYSIPDKSKTSALKNIDAVLNLGVPHVSAYTLIFEKGTLLHKTFESGKIIPNTDSEEAELYFTIGETLVRNGYNHYEVSNFAKPGFESRHNLKYWNFSEYAGFGPSAHSFFGNKRWNNLRSVSKYIEILGRGELPRENIEVQTPDKLEKDYFICVLRSSGVDIGVYNNLFGKNFLNCYDSVIRKHLESGNAALSEGFFRLTRKGFALADSITLDFLM